MGAKLEARLSQARADSDSTESSKFQFPIGCEAMPTMCGQEHCNPAPAIEKIPEPSSSFVTTPEKLQKSEQVQDDLKAASPVHAPASKNQMKMNLLQRHPQRLPAWTCLRPSRKGGADGVCKLNVL